MTIKLGLDLGQSSVKLTGAEGSVIFPSLAAMMGAVGAEISVGRRKRKPAMVVDGLFVGHNAHRDGIVPLENFSFDRLAGTTPEMRAILRGTLTEYQRKYGRFEEDVRVVVGLPMQMMTGEDKARYERAVKGWIGGHHQWKADDEEHSTDITRVDLAPQAIGALIDYVFGMDGLPVDKVHGDAMKFECAMISIGSNTVELQVAKRDDDTRRFNGGQATGVRWLHNQVDPNAMWTFGEFDEMLRAGDLPNGIDIDDYLGPWFTQVDKFIGNKWGDSWKRFHKIFVVGGGSLLLRPYLETKFNSKEPLAVFFDDPILTISRGLYKSILRK